MFSSPRRERLPVCAWLAVVLAAALAPTPLHAGFASAQCIEKDGALKFEYRLQPEARVESVSVTQNGGEVEARHAVFDNNPLYPGAILVMVDTSAGNARAPRDRTLAYNKALIQTLMAEAQPQDFIGVYGFANDLAEIAPLSRPDTAIRFKLAGMKADGLGTRIYRQGIQAVELLAAAPAAHKALVILSDGKDEDNGFTREDLQKSALAHGVAVCALGCPETGLDVPTLGNLEKLAVETHGLYAQAKIGEGEPGERLRADTAFVHNILSLVNSGGEITVALDRLAATGDVLFAVKIKGGETFTHLQPRNGAVPAPSAAPADPPSPTATPETSAAAPATTPTPAPAAREAKPRPAPAVSDRSDIGRLISIGSVVLLLAAVILIRSRSRPPRKPATPPREACLLMQDAESRRIPVTGIATRIGRRPDNDIVFSNTSISGYHAEIHLQRDGSYLLTDLGSGNGLRVNDERVSQALLKDGDLVEMGEVRFRFQLSEPPTE